jgi:hypothetical protein
VIKWMVILGVLLVVLAAASFTAWEHSPRQEMVRSQAAVRAAASWHLHNERVFLNVPPETVDLDVVCPDFQHRISRSTAPDGTTMEREFIQFHGQTYNRVAGEWLLAKSPASKFWDCDQHGTLLDGDGNSLPYAAILNNATIQRGALRQSGFGNCRDYEILVPVPTNILERECRFVLCINEVDHLPRETRRTPRGADHQDVKLYSEWNEHTEPQLPADFPR